MQTLAANEGAQNTVVAWF